MTEYLLFWFLFVVNVKAVTFFHEPSYIEIVPSENSSDFGSTLAFQPIKNSLVVGAPFSDLNGKVYLCSMDNVVMHTKIMCNQIPIDFTKQVPNYSRTKSPDQHFGLGASISITPDYIFTCAPLVTLDIPAVKGNSNFGACGTCFITNDTTTDRYYGMLEQYVQEMNTSNFSEIDINRFYGGVGWTTLPDVANKLILMAKPMPNSTLNIIDMDQPLKTVKVVDFENYALEYRYIGGALAYGNFFMNKPKLYAFSADRDKRFGFIAFLSYDDQEKRMELFKFGRLSKIVQIKDNKVGSMFGSTLHSTDLDGDNYTDLLVGAPARSNNEGSYETGAVHVYKGGVPVREFPRFTMLCIYSNKDGSRFGSSIATADLDEDGFPEIFVSAPYEDGGTGSVYIFSGHEVNQLFGKMRTSGNKLVPLSDLVYTQRIHKSELQTFGFSLQAFTVQSFDNHVLAIGSPMSGKVVLYRSIPIITVDLKAHSKDRVREQDSNFTVIVTVDITYPSNLKDITGKILVTTRIEGDAVWIDKGSYNNIKLSKKQPRFDIDFIVSLGDFKKGLYKFYATVQLDNENLKRKDYDSSLLDISPRSNTTTELSIRRECQGEDCVPNLSLTFQWSGSNQTDYILGSSAAEIMSLIVRNDGGATSGSCARIKVTGAKVALLECKTENGWYKCDLTDIERFTTRSILIRLDMSKPTNNETALVVEVMLFNDCTSKSSMKNYTKTIAYEFNTDHVYFNSTEFNRIITDLEIEDVEAGPYVAINELYTITNKGKITWGSLVLEIYLQKAPFIQDFFIGAGNCTKDDAQLKYNCTVDLEPDTTVKVQGTVTLVKDKIKDSLVKGKLKVVSHFKLHMQPTSRILENLPFVTEILYQKTTSLKNNVYLVIVVAVCLGAFVMAIIVIALFKGGFFKREKKQKLVELKHSIRKHSIRRPGIDGPPQCTVTGPESEQQDQAGGSAGSSRSEKSGVDDATPQKEVPAIETEDFL